MSLIRRNYVVLLPLDMALELDIMRVLQKNIQENRKYERNL
jgi:hypothetical protein